VFPICNISFSVFDQVAAMICYPIGERLHACL
jgi:hypothetical protein